VVLGGDGVAYLVDLDGLVSVYVYRAMLGLGTEELFRKTSEEACVGGVGWDTVRAMGGGVGRVVGW